MRAVLRLLTAVVLALGLLAPATNALAAPRTSVTITSPSAGATVSSSSVTVTGMASSPTGTVTVSAGIVNDVQVTVPVTKRSWTATLTGLEAGTNQICATVLKADGTLGSVSCLEVVVQPDPAALTVDLPEEGAQVPLTFQVAGGCVSQTEVSVSLDGAEPVTTWCDFNRYSVELTSGSGGDHSVLVTMTFGGAEIASLTRSFNVLDNRGTVTILEPTEGATVVEGSSVTLSGTAANWDGLVAIGGSVLETQEVPIAADGTWTATVRPYQLGYNLICAWVRNRDTSAQGACVGINVVIDPASLTVDQPTADAVVGSVLMVSGSCREGTEVRIVSDDANLAYTTCIGGHYDGLLINLSEGARTITVEQIYEGATVATASVSVTVDLTAPSAPVVTTPRPGSTITVLPVTLSGTAEPGTRVEVLLNGGVYATATTGSDGVWSLSVGRDYFDQAGIPLTKRTSVTFTLVAVDQARNTSAESAVSYIVRV